MPAMQWMREFKHPGPAFRGKPFWSWNGLMKPAELRRQVQAMASMGLGGFFMHSRVGLATPYLSEDWFKAVSACVDEARKLGLEAWLYDEDRWPSGAAGGLVTRDPQWRMQHLDCMVTGAKRALPAHAVPLAAFGAKADGCRLLAPRKLKTPTARIRPGEQRLIFFTGTAEPCSWYNGQTYLDTMNPAAVKRFIETTHEAYRKRYGKLFGSVIPGIFTDEPHRGPAFRRMQGVGTGTSVPWTTALPGVFRRRYGYDLLDHLPELFFEVDGREISPVRRDYYDCTTHLFCEAFGRLYGNWCGKHGLLMTGHLLMEDRLSDQTVVVGNCMRFYEHMQAPGMDLLTEDWRIFDTAKQVSSAARQFDRRWRLTETYGCTGWDFPFAGHKALGDWQVALGINLRCQHLAFYTMQGQAKRDYPAAISYQSPWWSSYHKVEDYFARLLSIMTRGKEVRDLLVIHPVESMWARWHRGSRDDPRIRHMDESLRDLRDTLLASHIDFDYAEEDLLARYGAIDNEEKDTPRLRLNKAEYTTVLLPPMSTVRGTTLDLLHRFTAAGGHVLFAGDPPAHVDARPSDRASVLAARCPAAPASGPGLANALACCRRVSIAGADGKEIAPILYLLREDKEAAYLFLCNLSHEFRGRDNSPPLDQRRLCFDEVRVRGFRNARGRPIEADPETGRFHGAHARKAGKEWEIRTSLPRLGSRLFIIPAKPQPQRLPKRTALHTVRHRKIAPPSWKAVLSESNALVLDRPRWRLAQGKPRKAEEILRLDHKVRDTLGLPRRGGDMAQPWTRRKHAGGPGAALELRYDFEVKHVPAGDLFLCLEQPSLYDLAINDIPIPSFTETGWWTDRSIRRLPVDPACLRHGHNELTLRCRYNAEHPGLEAVYLLGAFGVRVRHTRTTLTAPPVTLQTGDWTRQGLPFYAGHVTYETRARTRLQKGERLFLRIPQYRGVALRILADGQPVGIIAWDPPEIEMTEAARSGSFLLGIEVLGHRRNAFGPLHLKNRESFVGPHSFATSGDRWDDNYVLAPCGLLAPPEWHVRERVRHKSRD